MKFEELKVDQLKKELSKLELPSTGNKAELQKRLIDEFKRRNIEIDSYEFDNKEEMEVSTQASTNNMDFSTMFAALMGKMEENTRASNENTRASNEKLLQKIEENARAANENAGAMNEKLQEISEAVNSRVEVIEKQVSKINKELSDLANNYDKKFNDLESKIHNVQIQEGPIRSIPDVSSKIKTPSFDATTPFNVFKFQFETVANKNLWNAEEKAIQLILALKGNAAQVLESIPISSRNNYEDIMTALQRKYGGEHRKELYRMELRGRLQKTNEPLQDFAMEIERLVQVTYPGEIHPLLEQLKIEAFVNGIRDPDVKLAAYTTPKSSFAETVAYALAQETARLVSKPQVYKVRNLEVVPEQGSNLVNDIKNAVKEALAENQNQVRAKCYNCGKMGHIQRNCRAPRKRSRSTSPPRNSKRTNLQASHESPLN